MRPVLTGFVAHTAPLHRPQTAVSLSFPLPVDAELSRYESYRAVPTPARTIRFGTRSADDAWRGPVRSRVCRGGWWRARGRSPRSAVLPPQRFRRGGQLHERRG